MNSKIKILVPVNFSDESINGLKTAIDIAKRNNGCVHLLHIIEEPISIGYNSYGDTIVREKALEGSSRYVSELIRKQTEILRGLAIQYHNRKVPVDFSVEIGPYKEGLKNFLEIHNFDLIVMGTTGETSLSEIFSGNHTEQAIHIADVPVLAVKKYIPRINLDKILLGIELRNYNEKAVNLIKKFAGAFNAKIVITHVKENKDAVIEDIISYLHQFVIQHDIRNYSLIVANKGHIDEELIKVANENNVDIIATISENNNGLLRLIFGSETENVIENTEKPVLVIHE